jgi:hypothetical protein
MDEFLGCVRIPLEIVTTEFPVDRWWSLFPYPGTKGPAFGAIHLRLHHRKAYDDTSEAAEEIKIINHFVEFEKTRMTNEQSVMRISDSRSPDHYNAKYNLTISKDKSERCSKRKMELVERTLLSRPLALFEVDDDYVFAGTVDNDIVRRQEKCDEFIHYVTEELRLRKLHSVSSNATIAQLLTACELRLEYLIYYASYLAVVGAQRVEGKNEE